MAPPSTASAILATSATSSRVVPPIRTGVVERSGASRSPPCTRRNVGLRADVEQEGFGVLDVEEIGEVQATRP